MIYDALKLSTFYLNYSSLNLCFMIFCILAIANFWDLICVACLFFDS